MTTTTFFNRTMTAEAQAFCKEHGTAGYDSITQHENMRGTYVTYDVDGNYVRSGEV